jgi:RNA binding exosome subunit
MSSKKESLLSNPIMLEFARLMSNKTLQNNLKMLNNTLNNGTDEEQIDEMAEKMKYKQSDANHRQYLRRKKMRMIEGIMKRFNLLSKPDQISVIVQLNNMFTGDL